MSARREVPKGMKRLAGSTEFSGAGEKCWDNYRRTELETESSKL